MPHQHADKDIQRKSATKPPDKASPTPQLDGGNLMDLQRTLGNQAVQRLMAEGKLHVGSGVIQAKLTVGPADDPYEREADAVASQVMAMPDTVQREAPEEEELAMKRLQRDPLEEDELQMQRIQREAPEEEELAMKRLQRDPLEEDELQMQRIQREAPPEEEEMQLKRIQRQAPEEDELQMKSSAGGVPEVTSDLEGQIEGARGSGQALPDTARNFFEPRFGQDFSGVTIHTGAEADTLNRQLEARAFTTGSDIFFREGEYNPDSAAGRELLAHELTHVVQQGGSQAQRQPDESEAS